MNPMLRQRPAPSATGARSGRCPRHVAGCDQAEQATVGLDDRNGVRVGLDHGGGDVRDARVEQHADDARRDDIADPAPVRHVRTTGRPLRGDRAVVEHRDNALSIDNGEMVALLAPHRLPCRSQTVVERHRGVGGVVA
jgi:hypothetical protein